MKKIYLSVIIYLIFGCQSFAQTADKQQSSMHERINRVKNATVQIIVNGEVAGTGFVISEDGLIATCFNVVKNKQTSFHKIDITNGTIDNVSNAGAKISSSIEVKFYDGTKLSAKVSKYLNTQEKIHKAYTKDYCILKIKSLKKFKFLALGSFADAYEGANLYLSGFPAGIDQPIVSVGMLSTKYVNTNYIVYQDSVKTAWIDIPTNKGNSGSPVILMGKEPKDDKVIGIASFELSPYSKITKDLENHIKTIPQGLKLFGLDIKKFYTIISESVSSNSVGVSGCISIDYIKSALDTKL